MTKRKRRGTRGKRPDVVRPGESGQAVCRPALRRGVSFGGLVILAVMLTTLAAAGCVRRRLTVRSDPPGAVVYIDRRSEPIGTTPVSTSFTYYGTRTIQLVKDGYETLTVQQHFSPPWYEIPPLDFFFENLWPREWRDERIVEVHLEPQRRVSADEVIGRARQLRQATYEDLVTPLPPPAQQSGPPPGAVSASPAPGAPPGS